MSDGTIRVLLVEDDEDDYLLTRQLLDAIAGVRFTIDWEASYEGGRTALLGNRHDVGLIDYRLGERSGLDLVVEAIEAGCRAPLIFLTGVEDRLTDLEAMKAGAADYLIKGRIDPTSLERSIRYAIERKLREKNAELQSTILAKDRFLASISHELRTPLNVVIGFTGTLLMQLPGPLNAEQERQLRTVQSSTRYLLSLINDLLDLAKIDAGKVEINREPIRLAEMLPAVVETLRVLAAAKGLKLEAPPPGPDLILETDRRLLTQILLNLTSNAIKYTTTGGIRLEAGRIGGGGGASPTVAISVVDTGIGIKPEDRDRLFQAFQRVGARQSSQQQGSGLGLHLSRKMASLLGGRIDLVSEYGVGSRFTLELPG